MKKNKEGSNYTKNKLIYQNNTANKLIYQNNTAFIYKEKSVIII